MFYFGFLWKVFYGLWKSELREISLINMYLYFLCDDFFFNLSNMFLVRVYFDSNVIVNNVGDLMFLLFLKLWEILFYRNWILNVLLNIIMLKMEIFILRKNNLLFVLNFCFEFGY